MRASLDTGSLSPHLPAVYRFGFLMTGDPGAAAAVLRDTVERAARSGIADLRDVGRVKRWLFTEARRQCGEVHALPAAEEPDAPGPDASEAARRLAARFVHLPEPDRAALVLFYLYLFGPSELAEVLEIPEGELVPVLSRGRKLLGQQSLERETAA